MAIKQFFFLNLSETSPVVRVRRTPNSVNLKNDRTEPFAIEETSCIFSMYHFVKNKENNEKYLRLCSKCFYR